MTVEELMYELEGLDPNSEVRFASQPSWPFEYNIAGIVSVEVDGEEVVYLEEGRQLGYLPGEVKDELGW
jgi:hypothetical protein